MGGTLFTIMANNNNTPIKGRKKGGKFIYIASHGSCIRISQQTIMTRNVCSSFGHNPFVIIEFGGGGEAQKRLAFSRGAKISVCENIHYNIIISGFAA